MTSTRYKLVFFVPQTALQACKTAIFAAGAGRYFPSPSPSSNPHPLSLNIGLGGSPLPVFSSGGLPKPSAPAPAPTYTECCWTVLGTGQFRPGDGANPHLGVVGELEEVEEARVETVCVGGEEEVRRVVAALKR